MWLNLNKLPSQLSSFGWKGGALHKDIKTHCWHVTYHPKNLQYRKKSGIFSYTPIPIHIILFANKQQIYYEILWVVVDEKWIWCTNLHIQKLCMFMFLLSPILYTPTIRYYPSIYLCNTQMKYGKYNAMPLNKWHWL